MRVVMLVALLLVATPLAAQSPLDTSAIRAAALTFAERFAPLRVPHITPIVADTAWVAIYDPRTGLTGGAPSDSTTGWTGVRTREVRLERRNGLWVRTAPSPPRSEVRRGELAAAEERDSASPLRTRGSGAAVTHASSISRWVRSSAAADSGGGRPTMPFAPSRIARNSANCFVESSLLCASTRISVSRRSSEESASEQRA